jgi:hypothetical protein
MVIFHRKLWSSKKYQINDFDFDFFIITSSHELHHAMRDKEGTKVPILFVFYCEKQRRKVTKRRASSMWSVHKIHLFCSPLHA